MEREKQDISVREKAQTKVILLSNVTQMYVLTIRYFISGKERMMSKTSWKLQKTKK